MDVHVIPVNDLFPHSEKGLSCGCTPRRDFESPTVIIHNAFDGRELRELATEFKEVSET